MGTHYNGTKAELSALNLFIKLSRAAESVSGRINAHLRQVKLTESQFGVLEAIYHLGPMHQNKLAEKILKSGGNLTMVIDNLVKRKFVTRQRDADDRRCYLINLTAEGKILMDELFPLHVEIVVNEMAVLTPAEQQQLATLCRKLGTS